MMLKSLPLSQREKSYSAETGVVYQYIFAGLAGRKHVFDVTADRQSPFQVAVDLTPEALAPCAERMGSALRWNEEYALAKLCLFAAFDREVLVKEIRPDSEELLLHMTALNLG
ncbi:hypothetical protein [Bryobacter aggregatus]|uniref:hypothetical protein n=1 Tax=Bryobacter aggregatus TaxID=360054 RepID=UPI0004E17EBD|nr:hypothetical protein [Bryobacter aggregatus]